MKNAYKEHGKWREKSKQSFKIGARWSLIHTVATPIQSSVQSLSSSNKITRKQVRSQVKVSLFAHYLVLNIKKVISRSENI